MASHLLHFYLVQVFTFNLLSRFSVARFGEISPIWQNYESYWQIFEGLFSIMAKL